MSYTIEISNEHIINRLEALSNIIEVLNIYKFSQLPKLSVDVQNITDIYELGSVSILTKYFYLCDKNDKKNEDNVTNKELILKEYNLFIQTENILSKLDRFFRVMTTIYQQNIDVFSEQHSKKINKEFLIYNKSKLINCITYINYDICEKCNIKMDIKSIDSEMICSQCGAIHPMYGTVFDDELIKKIC